MLSVEMGKASDETSFRREDQNLSFRHVEFKILIRPPSVAYGWVVGNEGLAFRGEI